MTGVLDFPKICKTVCLIAYILIVQALISFNAYAQEIGAPAPTRSEPAPTLIESPSPNDVREFRRLLADPKIQNWLLEEANAEDNTVLNPQISIRETLSAMASKVRARLADLKEAVTHMPDAHATIISSWNDAVSGTETLRMITYILIFLFIGAGFEWLYAQYTHHRLLMLEFSNPDGLNERFKTALLRALITFGGLLVFSIGSIGAYLIFDWPALVADIVLNVLIVVLVVRLATTIARFFLAPKYKELRLAPFNSMQAKSVSRWITFSIFAAATNFAISDIFGKITGMASNDVPKFAALSVDIGANLIWLAVAIIAIWRIRRLFVNSDNQNVGNPFWAIYLTVLSSAVFMLWLLGIPSVMWSVLLIGCLFPVLAVTGNWVGNLYDQAEKVDLLHGESDVATDLETADTVEVSELIEHHAEQASQETESEDAAIRGRYETYRPLTLRIIRFFIIIATVLGLMIVWGTNVFSLSTSTTFSGRLFEIAVDVVIALLIADLIWVWAKSAIDRKLADYVPPEPGQAPGPEARMATLLPLLRSILMFTLLAMVALSILSSFGVNIGPLIAGAGVVGVAVGFGAQALVRDVVSGIFFLIDDAFRIGEYIEVDGLVGTVEAMSIRSLRVRHHLGVVHTIPFGELKSLSNHSRDWVIMKLEFRVPFETDLKLVKKLVKKIGAEMAENEDWGGSIIETLKFQGVRRMEEFNMVVGVKFMTKPGEQWIIRREAYQRVRDAFDSNGIVFAERNVKVEVISDRPLNEVEEKAVAGAIEDVVKPPSGPPVPIPDEPG